MFSLIINYKLFTKEILIVKIMLGDDCMASSKKVIPVKNYILLSVIMVVSIFLVYYFYLWFQIYDKNKLHTPIMDNYLRVINYNELDSYLVENEYAVIYVSVLGEENTREFEEDFKKVILDYSLKNDILYMDLTSYVNVLDSRYGVNNNNMPCIMMFENGKLIDIYDIASHNYSSKKVKKYLATMGVIEND